MRFVPASVLLLAGCLLPDASLLDRDAGYPLDGPDSMVDAVRDGSLDGPDAPWGCVATARVELACEDTRPDALDEDCDGLIGCQDFDCSSALSCCTARAPTPIAVASTDFSVFPESWIWMPRREGSIPQSGGALGDFGVSGTPRAVQVPVCLPIDLGVRIRGVLRADSNPPVCGKVPDCENYAQIALTATRDFARGEELIDELSLRFYNDGRAELRRSGALFRNQEGSFGRLVSFTIELSPGFLPESGMPWIYASVLVHGEGTPARTWMAMDHEPAFPTSDLLGAGAGCSEVPGLYLAIQGIGRRVSLDDLDVQRFQCANPGHFAPAGAIGEALRVEDVGAASWATGGIGAPAISSTLRPGGAIERWELLYDASDVPRGNEPSTIVRTSIGGAISEGVPGEPLRFMPRLGRESPHAPGAPIFGFDPPNCASGTIPDPPGDCTRLEARREPTLGVPLADESTREYGSSMWVAFAKERADESRAYEIVGAPLLRRDENFSAEPSLTILTPEVSGCRSLRDPLLLPIDSTWSSYWLLFTCEREWGEPSSIGIARVDEPLARATLVRADLLSPAQLGTFAAGGLRAPEGAAFFHEGGARVTYRLYFIGQTLGGSSLGYAEATADVGVAPVFVPYPANPVLRENDRLLGDCSALHCSIRDVAATRIASAPNTIRLLVAVMREPSGGNAQHVLVPLDQLWSPL